MEKMLLHSCCGPCSTVCIERLKEKYDLDIIGVKDVNDAMRAVGLK